MRTLIVGGGIGGLTAGIALAHDGHEVTVVEKSPDFHPIGAGIIMAPNASAILGTLGVDLSGHAHALRSLDVVDARGSLLQRIDTERLAARHGSTWALPRPALHELLLQAVPSRVHLLQGRAVTAVHQTEQSVSVRFDDDDEQVFDAVIGADGLRSTVRTQVLGPQPVRYSGVTCWRGLCANPGFTHATEAWGVGARIGVVPLRDDRLYYYLVATAPRHSPAPAWPEPFRRAFAGFSGDVTKIFDTLTHMPPLHHDLEEVDRPVWGRGRVLLLGDAAHAMTPNQGQGAAMAVEDAYALTLALRDGIDGALSRYTKLRHQRVRRIQLTSRRIGKLAHWTSPLARGARDALMRSVPQTMTDRQYAKLVQPAMGAHHVESAPGR